MAAVDKAAPKPVVRKQKDVLDRNAFGVAWGMRRGGWLRDSLGNVGDCYSRGLLACSCGRVRMPCGVAASIYAGLSACSSFEGQKLALAQERATAPRGMPARCKRSSCLERERRIPLEVACYFVLLPAISERPRAACGWHGMVTVWYGMAGMRCRRGE